jgi:hypothetical protein
MLLCWKRVPRYNFINFFVFSDVIIWVQGQRFDVDSRTCDYMYTAACSDFHVFYWETNLQKSFYPSGSDKAYNWVGAFTYMFDFEELSCYPARISNFFEVSFFFFFKHESFWSRMKARGDGSSMMIVVVYLMLFGLGQ